MTRLHFVGDGPRDERVLPALVEGIIQAPFEHSFAVWSRLHEKGLRKKIDFAVLQALDECASGLAAVVDADKDGARRLREMRKGRVEAQTKRVFPIAIGMADRHVESWLLDDEKAVREALQLPKDTPIPHQDDAKPLLHQHWLASPRHAENPAAPEIDVLGDIARGVRESRCNHAKQTGFAAFADEVRRELAPLFREPPRAA